MSVETLQSVGVAVIGVVLGASILRLGSIGRLTFRYTVGWLVLALAVVAGSMATSVAGPLARLIGVAPGVIATGSGVLVLVFIALQLSVSISGGQAQIRKLAEDVALLSAFPSQVPVAARNVLIVVPAFNEESSVGCVVSELVNHGFATVVVDDGSTDRTRERALACGAVVVSLPYNTGVGGALRTGLRYATMNGYETVVQCDADGQHPISHINHLLAALEAGDSDMVIGSRFANGQAEHMRVSAIRRFAMWTLAASASRAVGVRVTDVTSGFRAWQGELVFALAEHLPAYYLGDTYEAVVAAGRAGYRVQEIPSPISERLHGSSSAGPVQAARFTVRAFLTAVLHLHVRLPAASNRAG